MRKNEELSNRNSARDQKPPYGPKNRRLGVLASLKDVSDGEAFESEAEKALKNRVRFLEKKLRAINCGDCNGTELKHKRTCEWRD